MNQPYSFSTQEIEEGKGLAGVAYLTIIGFIVALITGSDNRFTMYHVQQALALFILFFAAGAVMAIPILGWIAGVLGWIFGVVCFFIGLVNGFQGKAKPLPLIGELAYKFNLVKERADLPRTGSDKTPPPPPPPSH